MDQLFFKKIYQAIRCHNMIREGEAILVGVSGGPDSVALLHALMVLSGSLKLELGVAHLNHCLRQTADHEEAFVESMAKEYSLPVFIEKQNILALQQKTGRSLEETGRDVRYQFFNRICRDMGYDKIAVAHHADDNAEQVLLNLLRGSGSTGISGIPPVRENIIRPLIHVSRTRILSYLKARNLTYVMDPSNTDPRFVRNRIRHRLMPLLKTDYNPKISETLNRLAKIRHAEEDWIKSLINPLFKQALLHTDTEKLALSVSALRQFHPAARRRVLRKAILTIKGDLRRITSLHIHSIMGLIDTDYKNEARLDLPDRIRILRQAEQLFIVKETQNLRRIKPNDRGAVFYDFKYTISDNNPESQSTLFIPEVDCLVTLSRIKREQIHDLTGDGRLVAFLDADHIKFPVTIRSFKPGDRFQPFGMTGSQKVKDFFINNKIKPVERAAIPIFTMGDTILWIGGYRIADPYKITQKTHTVLRVELFYNRSGG